MIWLTFIFGVGQHRVQKCQMFLVHLLLFSGPFHQEVVFFFLHVVVIVMFFFMLLLLLLLLLLCKPYMLIIKRKIHATPPMFGVFFLHRKNHQKTPPKNLRFFLRFSWRPNLGVELRSLRANNSFTSPVATPWPRASGSTWAEVDFWIHINGVF